MRYLSFKKTTNCLYFSKLKNIFTISYPSLLFLSFFYLFFIFSSFAQSDSLSITPSTDIETDSEIDSAIETTPVFQDSISTITDTTQLKKLVRTKFSVGFRGGLTRASLAIANPEKNDKNKSTIGSVFTIFMNYRLNSTFSIQPEIGFGRYRSDNTLYKLAAIQGMVDYTTSTIDLNVMGIYAYPIQDWFSLSVEVGPSVAYSVHSFGKVVAPNVNIGGIYDLNTKKQFEKVNYGALLGINPSFHFKSVTLQTSIRYRYGLNNLNTFDYTTNRYLADASRTIKTRDILFQLGFFIPIYKVAKKVENVEE